MIELPEASVLSQQINQVISGKRINRVTANYTPMRFAWFTGDPLNYHNLLSGKFMGQSHCAGGFVEIEVENVKLAISASIQFHSKEQKRPIRHQLLLEFDDETAMSASCQLWGSFLCFQKDEISKNMDYVVAIQKPSPLSNEFDEIYFKSLFNNETPKKSVKEFLGTEQRIPGLGNGVLQDILWNAGIHPKRKMAELSEGQINGLYHAVKNILKKMEAEGGRDTEYDLFNQPGGYKTKMSKKTVGTSCPTCGTRILKESYLGGSVYICNGCQH